MFKYFSGLGMAKVRRGSSEGPPAACSGPGNRVQLGKPGLPTSPRGLRPSKQPKRRTGSSAKLGTPTPLALAVRQGELTDAACELGPQASHPVPPPWARECPCRLGPCRVPGASSSGQEPPQAESFSVRLGHHPAQHPPWRWLWGGPEVASVVQIYPRALGPPPHI